MLLIIPAFVHSFFPICVEDFSGTTTARIKKNYRLCSMTNYIRENQPPPAYHSFVFPFFLPL